MMYLFHPGWLRVLVVLVLVILGIILRFILPSRIGGFGLRRFRTHPDEDIATRIRQRVGDLLLLWALWVMVQIGVGMRESWTAAVWAPLLIVITLVPSYAARLYAGRYLARRAPDASRGGWLLVVIREGLPMAAILVSILIVRSRMAELPEQIPVTWNPWRGALEAMERRTALDLLRHRTMFVYLLLFGLEGLYLLVTLARGRGGDFAERMLSRPHWLYFIFKLGWVLLFAGLNVGLVNHAATGGPVFIYLAPGIAALTVLGLAVALDIRRSPGSPGP
jgi:hypothetical protein